ncbi:MAG: sulfatase-like hydrolase/transferase, partial [Gemmatimonadetes bacterium]|nr:sulfatase-like hydrolase/transferase [Gemmatimonadota bacterium]
MAESKRPNIVFVFADDWGWGDLSCYGHQFVKTPNLDRLASQGILFSQFYVCSSSVLL